MWTSIKYVERPESLEKACSLVIPGRKVPFAGGSYLAAERPLGIDTLIDINHLVSDHISLDGSHLRIGAGATLQQIVQYATDNSLTSLAECARLSCQSRNIRNQRTIGGEIGRRRTDSELVTCLLALDTTLEVTTSSPHSVSIREWTGEGIVNEVCIDQDGIHKMAFQRFAIIPTAPPIVFVVAVRRDDRINVAVGGTASEVTVSSIEEKDSAEEAISRIAETTIKHFTADHYGSPNYKAHLVRIGLARALKE